MTDEQKFSEKWLTALAFVKKFRDELWKETGGISFGDLVTLFIHLTKYS